MAIESKPGNSAEPNSTKPKSVENTVAEPDELPPFSEQMSQQLGGIRGVIEAAIPITVFVILNPLLPDMVGPFEGLHVAIVSSVVAALSIAGFRFARKESPRYALNGLFGVAIGSILAWRSGDARDYYVFGIYQGLIYGVALIISALVKQPIVGWIYAVVAGGGKKEWRQDSGLLKVLCNVTIVWGFIFILKNILRLWLYETHATNALGMVTLFGGWPITILLTAWTVFMVRTRRADRSNGL